MRHNSGYGSTYLGAISKTPFGLLSNGTTSSAASTACRIGDLNFSSRLLFYQVVARGNPPMFFSKWQIAKALCFSMLASCSVYDENLTKVQQKKADSRIAEVDSHLGNDANAIPTNSRDEVGGGGGDLDSSSETGGSIAPVGEDSSEEFPDGDEVEFCGDGKISGEETCDTAISAGTPGFCPTECPSDDPCLSGSLEGSGCLAECVYTEIGCVNDDGCCLPDCNVEDDNDCSSQCGDGIVQTEDNEICEPAEALDNDGVSSADLICPTECEDDGDPCTAQLLTGSASNCNAVCTWPTITTAVAGDGCCPTGANANTDDDCKSVCGNGIKEPDEACDGSINEGCSPQCDSYTTDQRTCIENFTDITDECRICICTRCTDQVINCMASGDTTNDELCSAVVYCGLETGCLGNACYCGGTDPNTICLFGSGPCVFEIEQAAGTTNTLQIFRLKDDPNTTLGRSTAYSICHLAECLDVC